MKLNRYTKTPSHHATPLVWSFDGDPHEFSIGRNEKGELQFNFEDWTHTFALSLTEKEEAILLSKLKSTGSSAPSGAKSL
jgi:hypothetical protein